MATERARTLSQCRVHTHQAQDIEEFKGRPSGGNPWRATTLEWQTPETPPGHGNWGKELPVVYRWAYDYSVPGAAQDFIPQNQPRATPVLQGAAP